MTFDTFVAAAIAAEAEREVGGAWVDQVHQPGPLQLVLSLNARGGKQRWLFSADARLARVHREEDRRENPAQAPGFSMLLRKHLNGARLVGIEQPAFDRVLQWRFRRGDERRTLVAEVMGKHSNVLLLDEAGVILDAIKRVPASISRARQVLPGLPYTPPPAGDRADPRGVTREAFQKLFPEEAVPADALVKRLSGFGPFAAAEVLARGRDASPDAVWEALRALLARVEASEFAPHVLLGPDGSPRGFWCFEARQWPADQQEARRSVSACAAAYYGHVEQTANVEGRRGELRARVRGAWERAQRQMQRIEEDAAEGDRAEAWRIQGELLAGNQWQARRGDAAVEVVDYYDPEQRKRVIELDTELSPQENVERLFRRHRKAVDAAASARARREEVTATLARMAALREAIESVPPERLGGLEEEMNRAGVPASTQGASAAPGGRAPEPEWPAGVRIRRQTVGDWEILYGENATSNDYLTTRVARPHDWWLHVRASASAHVVIRSPHRDQPPPPDVLQAAARVAAAHSESKHASIVPVDYVQRKHVRKPRRSAPGLVTYQNEKTLFVDTVKTG